MRQKYVFCCASFYLCFLMIRFTIVAGLEMPIIFIGVETEAFH